jgi:hypothetical protein
VHRKHDVGVVQVIQEEGSPDNVDAYSQR